MNKNKAGFFLVLMFGLIAILGCQQGAQVNNDIQNSDPGSNSYSASGKEWKSYDLDETDITIDLPGSPGDKSPPLPPAYKEIFSAMHIYSYDEKDLNIGATELVPTGKRKWKIEELAETSMGSLKRQMPDLTYTLDVTSDAKARYNGTFTRNGQKFEVRGCCIYKKTAPARVWAVLTLYGSDNADALAAAQRVIDSAVFKGSDEECK